MERDKSPKGKEGKKMTYDIWFTKDYRLSLVLEDVDLATAEAYVAEESLECDPYEEGYEITIHGEEPAL